MSALLHFKRTCSWLLLPYPIDIGTLSPKLLSIALPEDVLGLICQSYIESVLSEAKTIRDLRERGKEYWDAVAPLAKTSTYLRKIVLEIWRTAWANCCAMQYLSHTRCRGSRLPPGTRVLILSNECEFGAIDLTQLNKLQCLSIGYHNLLQYDGSQRQFSVLPAVKALPSSLKRLEILHFHGPIQHFFSLVKSYCPKLVELRLVRCTMFSHPECMWWRINSHRDYLIGHLTNDVHNHATALAGYIEGLTHLERFHIDTYFTDTGSVLRHRFDHRRHHPRGSRDCTSPVDGVNTHNALQLAARASQDEPPINPGAILLAKKPLWTATCPQCEYELQAQIEHAERLAAGLLSRKCKSLKDVSFGSFLSPGRTGPSEWRMAREDKDDRLLVWIQRPVTGRPCPRYCYEFDHA